MVGGRCVFGCVCSGVVISVKFLVKGELLGGGGGGVSCNVASAEAIFM